jgi:hypothetical protein
MTNKAATVGARAPGSRDETVPDAIAAFGEVLLLELPDELIAVWEEPPPAELDDILYRPTDNAFEPPSVMWALAAMRRGEQRPPRELVPLLPIDDRSFACVVCGRRGRARPEDFGMVVRWHLDDVPARGQRQPFDTDAQRCVRAAAREERFRHEGKQAIIRHADEYWESHGKDNRQPRAHVVRPLRFATQNVVIGEAAFAHASAFDGLAVKAWHTSQEPHVNAHEGTRAMVAITLAEAFRSGGTMEVRFDNHPEQAVPAVLAQWARVHGVELDDERPAITPAQARLLLLEATEMPDELRGRVAALASDGGLSLERACYMLISGIWRPVELDFLLGVSGHAPEILRGDSDPLNRPRRQADLDVCRAAVMIGTLLQRLEQRPDDTPKVIEDQRQPVTWTVLGDQAAVRFSGVDVANVPWTSDRGVDRTLTVLPRLRLTADDVEAARKLSEEGDAALVLLPADAAAPEGSSNVRRMRYPDRRSVLDRSIEARLLSSRVGRR